MLKIRKYLFVGSFILLNFSLAYAQPKLALSKGYWEFGRVQKGSVLRENLIIYNKGSSQLDVSARPSCECLKISPASTTIPPSGSIKIQIVFDTLDFTGKKTEYIFIDTNDPDNPSISWLIEGVIDLIPVKKTPEKISKINVNSSLAKPIEAVVRIEVYSTPSCSYCNKLKDKIVPELARKYHKKTDLVIYPLDIPQNYERLIGKEKLLNDQKNKLPALIIGNVILGGKEEIVVGLEKEFSKANNEPQPEATPYESVSQEISRKINSLGIIPVILAGLVDGFNPCAFAGIVFLVAYLGMVQKKSHLTVFLTGMMFILGIFVVYFLIGLGLSKFFTAISSLKLISILIYRVMGILTLILAYLSFRDYLVLGKEESSKNVTLQLPMWIKIKMNDVIRKYTGPGFLIPAGFFLGVIISFMEFFCTGQIYLPTIMYMSTLSAMKTKAVAYLLLYSFMFIFPLIIIFAVLFAGLKSGRVKAMGQENVRIVKLLTSFVFLGLALFLLVH